VQYFYASYKQLDIDSNKTLKNYEKSTKLQ